MRKRGMRFHISASIALVAMLLLTALPALAVPIESDRFWRTWARTDKPVADGDVVRTWIWGPEAYSEMVQEEYDDAPGGLRWVQYFDKSRMEDNSYRADPPWDVTNARLAWELISGEMQVGDDLFEDRGPAWVNVAGDPDPFNGPTYAALGSVLDEPPMDVGSVITTVIDPFAYLWDDPDLASYGVTAAYYVEETDHTIAAPFWEFATTTGTIYLGGILTTTDLFDPWFYATGYPITEAYWVEVEVGGTLQWVLIQCFERRCLTYTPENDPAWRVEMGNIGQHAYIWRYDQWPGNPPPMREHLYSTTLGDWDVQPTEFTDVEWDSGALQITMYSADEGWSFAVWTDDTHYPGEFGNIIVSVEVRALSNDIDAVGVGCVMARATPSPAPGLPDEVYILCLDNEGYVSAAYETYGDEYDYEWLMLPFRVAGGFEFALDWHELAIISYQDTLWFLVDGDIVGAAIHSGRFTGEVGFMVQHFGDVPGTWQFRNLEVRAVGY